jgi:prepilin signal peptidase PulO-like enzyme (type II secretory pathway)
MGVGDIKMGFILGILFDWQLAVVALYLSFISASIVGVYLLLFKKKQIKILPFAPFIAFGSILSVVYGNKIIYAFLSII